MERVLYFTGLNLTVYQWQGKEFVDSYTFSSSDEGLKEFSRYLETIEAGTVKILADVVEEDFIKDNIPHVGHSDRRAIAGRYINRHYRKSDGYYTSKILGREKIGRKDDIILYGVLTNPDIFSKWLDIMGDKKIALAGIWSLPLISENILNKITSVGGNLLLVSQQVSSNIRQSFFINGRYEISRSAVINLDDMSIGEYINEEVELASRFLANQRYIGFDDVVNVHVICPEYEIENIKQRCEESPLKHFHYHPVAKVKDICGCSDIPGELSSAIFAQQCRSSNNFSGHYGPKLLFRYFYQKLIRNSIYTINAIIVAISIIIIMNNLISAQVLNAEAIKLHQQKDKIVNEYNYKYKKYEQHLNRALAMKSSVLFYDRVESLRVLSPQYFMNKFSSYLNMSGVDNIIITEVSWDSKQGDAVYKNNKSTDLQFSSDKNIKHFAKVKGLVGSKFDNFDVAVKKVHKLLAELNRHDEIEKLEIVKMPYDTRPGSNLNNRHSQGDKDVSINSTHRSFEFHIILKGKNNV